MTGYRRLARARSAPVAASIGLLLLGVASSLQAAEVPPPVTLDVPIPLNRALPAWLGQPSAPATFFATLNLPILAPEPAASLLVTVYFQEKQGGFLRVIWNGTQGAQVLSDNFYEDIGMPNQRALLLSPAMLIGDGTLTFQSSDASLGIQRMKLEWLESKNGLVSPLVHDLLVTPALGTTERSLSLSGLPAATTPGAWQDQIATVPLIDAPVRIEQGVDFSIDLDQVPGTARIALQETGLPLGQHLVVWINEQRAGTVTPSVPDLLDGGYLSGGNAVTSYVGWRDASFYAPVSLLKSGVNAVQFSVENDTPKTSANSSGTDGPLAIKGLAMQLNYTPASTATAPVRLALFPPATTQASATSDVASPQFLSPTGPDLRPESSETTSP